MWGDGGGGGVGQWAMGGRDTTVVLAVVAFTGSFERFLIIIRALALHDEKALTAKNRRLFSPNIR